jgi:hypothetical protein
MAASMSAILQPPLSLRKRVSTTYEYLETCVQGQLKQSNCEVADLSSAGWSSSVPAALSV